MEIVREMRAELAATIKSFKLEDHVFLLGFIPEASRYLPGCDYVLLPSVKEGLPYVLLEAIRAGRSIVATQVGGIADILSGYPNGRVVAPRRPRAIPDAILELERAKTATGPETERMRNFGLHEMVRATSALYRGS